jgi:hypothetical protein
MAIGLPHGGVGWDPLAFSAMTAGKRRGSFPSARRSTRRVVLVIVGVVVFAIVVAEVAADVVNSGAIAARVVDACCDDEPRTQRHGFA